MCLFDCLIVFVPFWLRRSRPLFSACSPGFFSAKYAAHASVFPRCSVVFHHGGAGTTAQALRSGVPSVIVPFLHWADQDDWGRFIEGLGAGVFVDLRKVDSTKPGASQQAFKDALAAVLGPARRAEIRAAAARAGAFIEAEDGVAQAVSAFESHFRAKAGGQFDAALADLRHVAAPGTRLSRSQVFYSSAYVLFRPGINSRRATHKELCENRGAWFEELQRTVDEYPVYKEDWPKVGDAALDLAVHDLPHDTSKIEWWYFHAHLTGSDVHRTKYSVFGAVFSTVFDGVTLHHGHASLVNARTKKHTYRSIGDGRAPGLARAAWSRLDSNEYFKRALVEIYGQGAFPAPDECAKDAFRVETDRMDFALGDITLVKLDDGSYRVALGTAAAPADRRFEFDLTFRPTKAAVRNGLGGISPGGTNDHNLFYYSITRMDVSGTIREPVEPAEPGKAVAGGSSSASSSSASSSSASSSSASSSSASSSSSSSSSNASEGGTAPLGDPVAVAGTGWYDHEFGGDKSHRHARGSANPKYQWIWIGAQLDDGREVVYAVTDDPVKKQQLGKMAMVVAEDGSITHFDDEATLETHRTWASLRTYVEYGTAWTLTVGSGDDAIVLELEADVDGQELVSIISEPAYWEGRVSVKGRDGSGGAAVSGVGFVEQYGAGGDMANFRSYLSAVSKVVFASVEATLPKAPNETQMNRLILDDEFAPYIKGISKKVFVESMIEPVRLITDRCGKGWRSMGLLLAAYAVGGSPERLKPFVAFPEFLHVGSLIIDDIEDDSDVRRKGPSCHKVYGVPTAINAGTAAYFLGEGLTRQVEMTDPDRIELYRLYFNCLRGAHTGQALDMAGLQHLVPECIETGDFSPLEDNITITHRLKSGLPACTAARIGTLLGGGSAEQQAAMGDYFMALGLAFQIMDDVINLRGFQQGLKTHAEDLIEGKITVPVVKAYKKVSHEDRVWLSKQMAVAGKQADRDVDAVLAKLEECDAIDDCITEAQHIVEEAWARIEPKLPNSYAKLVLRAFGWFVVAIR